MYIFRTMRLAIVAVVSASFVASLSAAPATRNYKATIMPTSISAGNTGSFSLVILNCDEANCPGSATSPPSLAFGAATVAVPTGVVVDSGSLTVSATGGKAWVVSLSGSTIVLGAVHGNDKLASGGSLTLHFHATVPCDDHAYEWTTAVYLGMLNSDGTVNTVTHWDLFGSQPSVTVTGNCSIPSGFYTGDYCSYSQGGWGAPPHGNNPGQILVSNFPTVYPGGVTVGAGFSMTFSSASAVEAYLPATGTPGTLTGSLTNPTSTSAGVFGGQVLTLRLDVDFNNAGIIDGTKGSIALLKLAGTGTSLDGQTVTQILAAAGTALGGGALPAGYTLSSLETLVDLLNNAFDNCVPSDWAQTHLTK